MQPGPRTSRRGHDEKNRRTRLPERSSSFHGRNPTVLEKAPAGAVLQRPWTVPDLRGDKGFLAGVAAQERPRVPKLLMNVTIRGSVGTVQVVVKPESRVGDLVAAAVAQYVKEGRRPALVTANPVGFDLHYSQFSLESLHRDEKLVDLGSRNFFVCPKKCLTDTDDDAQEQALASSSSSSCSGQIGNGAKSAFDWSKFLDFLL